MLFYNGPPDIFCKYNIFYRCYNIYAVSCGCMSRMISSYFNNTFNERCSHKLCESVAMFCVYIYIFGSFVIHLKCLKYIYNC